MKHPPFIPSTLAAIGLVAGLLTSANAQITWDGNGTPNNGGNWSTAANWSTDVAPTTGNTAILDTTGANRTVTYDAAASGALGTLTMNQTSGFLNQLAVTRSSGFNVTNAITLGASGGGTAEIRIGDLSNNVSTTYLTAPSVTVNSGGLFSFQVGGNGTNQNQGSPQFSGNMTISGGTVGVVAATFTNATSQGNILGNVNLSSGTLRIADATSPTTRDVRIQIGGTLNATGGTIEGGRPGGGNQLVLTGGNRTHTIGSGVTISNVPTITVSASGSTLNLDATGTGSILNRSFGGANTTQTLTVKTSSGSGAVSVGRLEFGTSSANNVRSKIVLGSDLTTTYTSGGQPLNASFGPGAANNAEFELDLAGRIFNGTSNTAGWTPNINNAAKAKWFINSSSGNGVAQFSSINTSTANVETTFGANTTIQITGGNSSVINLSTGTGGGGTFDPTSAVLYSGSATTGSPAVLTANRTIPLFTTRQGFVRADSDLGSGSTIRVGDSNTVGVVRANADRSLAGVTLNSATANSGIIGWVSGGLDEATAGQGSGRARIAGATNTTLTGNLTLATDGGSAATDVRTEITAATGTTFTIAGAILSAGASDGVVFNASNVGSGTVRLMNASNNFSNVHGLTLSQGTLISGISGALNGAGTTITMVDGAVAANNTATVAFLTEGNQTVTQAFDLSNGGSGAVAQSYTLGVKDLSTTTFSAGISGRAYTTTNNGGRERNLILTAATGGSAIFSGNITQVAPGAGQSNLINVSKTGAGTVTLSGTNSYTGTTTVSAGSLIVNGNQSAATGVLSVSSGATLGGSGTIGGAATIAGTLAPGNSAGLLTFNSSLTLSNSATTVMEINGVGTFDAIDVGGLLTYGGNLTLSLGTTFSNGSYNFDLFDFDSRTSSFDTVVLTNSYTGNLINNGAGVWGLTSVTGSLTNTWTFTESSGLLALEVVPEPSTYALLALAAAGLGAHVMRRRRSR